MYLNKTHRQEAFHGVNDGIPIALGYLAISFTFGLYIVSNHLPPWLGVFISMTNFTSAGQFAGTKLMLNGAKFIEIAVTIFVINIRYILMSLSISQKVPTKTWQRLLIAFGVTDEVFAVASAKSSKSLSFSYMAGLIITPYTGWVLGTLLGSVASSLLPSDLQLVLGIALYCMFIAIIVPPMKKSRPIFISVVIAIIFSALLTYLTPITSGFTTVIAGVLASCICAFIFPLRGENS